MILDLWFLSPVNRYGGNLKSKITKSKVQKVFTFLFKVIAICL